jgi:HNH endonuclease/AP2 domain
MPPRRYKPHGPIAVDVEDQPLVMAHSWFRHNVGGSAARGPKRGEPRKQHFLHRLIMQAKAGEYVDHVNMDVLDNRRSNLRVCTIQQNCQNKKLRPDSQTGFKGVRKSKKLHKNPFVARIMTPERVRLHLGCFPTAETAARAYDEAARQLHGEFARCNF